MSGWLKFWALVVFAIAGNHFVFCQSADDSLKAEKKKAERASYIESLDTLLHLQTWISANQMNYTLVYSNDFKLVLSPSEINSLSLGFSYRYIDLGLSFTPEFLNSDKESAKKGQSERFSFRTSVSLHRFNLAFDLSSVKGFYLKNSADFYRTSLPDSPYSLFPDLKVGYFSMLLRYNVNPNFSTAGLTSGTQIQQRSAYSVLPSFQFATFKFHNDANDQGVTNENTYSTDLNLLFPVVGTWVISRKFSASLGAGPSIGVDFYKSKSLDDSGRLVTSHGTKFITGYTLQTAIGFNTRRFFAGFESRYRSYGHKIEDIARLIKQYSYFQVYIGWRLRAPEFAKKALDWVNKISPVDLE